MSFTFPLAGPVYGATSVPSLMYPLLGPEPHVTSPWGNRISPVTGKPSFHGAVDLRAPEGTPVLAIADAIVYSTKPNATCGWGVILHHPGMGLGSSYCHLSRVDVKAGQHIVQGTPIGLSGGREGHPGSGSAKSPHLHLSIYEAPSQNWSDWKPIDPWPFIRPGLGVRPAPPDDIGAPIWSLETLTAAKDQLVDWLVPRQPVAASSAIWHTEPHLAVRLRAENGQYFPPGEVPAGPYILQEFDGQTWISRSGVQLLPGRTYSYENQSGRMMWIPR